MRPSITVLLVTIFCISNIHAQNSSLSDPKPYFSAFIVSNIDSSLFWYQDILGFELINKTENQERGFYQANLRRGESLVELIQLNGTLSQNEASPHARIEGIFKVGFKVQDFDNWVEYLREKQVTFRGDVVNDPISGKRMVIVLDPYGNRIQFFEH